MITLALIPLYAIADRAFGMDRPQWARNLPWKGLTFAALVGGGYLAAGVFGALLPLAWAIWRTPAWKLLPGASMTPRSAGEIAATLVRHGIAVPPAMALAYWTGLDWRLMGVSMVAFAGFSTILGLWLAAAVDEAGPGEDVQRENMVLELIRGAAYGLAVWWAIS